MLAVGRLSSDDGALLRRGRRAMFANGVACALLLPGAFASVAAGAPRTTLKVAQTSRVPQAKKDQKGHKARPKAAKTPSLARLTAGQLLAAARKATAAELGVDWNGSERAGRDLLVVRTQAGRLDGTQTLTEYATNKAGQAALLVGRVTEIRIGPRLYLFGTSVGLERDGFTSCAATKEAGRWVVVGPAQRLSRQVAVDLTVSTTADLLNMSAPLQKMASGALLGKAVIAITGESSLSSGGRDQRVVYVKTSGLPLPVELAQSAYSTKALFGPWGHPPKVHAPAKPVQFQTSWAATPADQAACSSATAQR
ncbi:MAG TPA: hypothetical protein VME46_09940 [Acidimicrobiales bacterium]|nr:hypothetical protein [Acidimicrobiales bacterium]